MNVNEEQTFVTLCSLFILHNMLNKLRECEASHSNKATQAKPIGPRMFFIGYNAYECCFCFLKVKQTRLYFTFQCYSFKKNMAMDLDQD